MPTFVYSNNLQFDEFNWLDDSTFTIQISWENSWRLSEYEPPFNQDAVWLFVKNRQATLPYTHALLSNDPGDYVISDTSMAIWPVQDRRGIFITRRMAAIGPTGLVQLQVRLAEPVGRSQSGLLILGIEMVYIPKGGFYLGDGSSFHHFRDGSSGAPFKVSTESVIPVGQAAGELFDDGENPPAFHIPGSYPKGTAGFFCMKYEISQEQYATFLNCLTFQQQVSRTQVSPSAVAGTAALTLNQGQSSRNGIVISSSGGNSPAIYAMDGHPDGLFDQDDDGHTRACNFLSWSDLLAYLDWAALRPMTELEFEKICRGPQYPLAGEFAWGSSVVIDANTVLLDGTVEEKVSEKADSIAGLASHGYVIDGLDGPLRCGFGGNPTSGRLQAGAGYFGVWEMSGNLWELCVNVDSAGLEFEGQHGDGQLDEWGEANQPGWNLQAGAGHRGGGFNSGIVGPFRDLAVSDRFYIDLHPASRRSTTGGRGVRAFSGYQISDSVYLPLNVNVFKGGAGDGFAFFSTGLPSFLEKTQSRLSVSLFPNPATGIVQMRLRGLNGKPAQLILTDLNGKQLLCRPVTEESSIIHVEHLSAGWYFLKITMGNSIFSQKIWLIRH